MGCLLCLEQPVVINPENIDDTHFEKLKVVGKGGFGKVNAVMKRTTGELLALKRMAKKELLKKKVYMDTVWIERSVMSKVSSPFCLNSLHCYETSQYLCIIMPFMQGGDLHYNLKTKGAMSEEHARFYAAEILLGLENLHQLNVIYRDLKPSNCLLDTSGHLRLSDFGLSVFLTEENNFKCRGGAGTPGYRAPELLNRKHYNTSVDVYSYGITLYELLHRSTPFDERKGGKDKIKWGEDISEDAKDLITGLLRRDPEDRYACGETGWNQVKEHPWFKGFDWKKCARKEMVPPIKPDTDRANCSSDFELEDQMLHRSESYVFTDDEKKNFDGFGYNLNISNDERKELDAAANRRFSIKHPHEVTIRTKTGGEVEPIPTSNAGITNSKISKQGGGPPEEQYKVKNDINPILPGQNVDEPEKEQLIAAK